METERLAALLNEREALIQMLDAGPPYPLLTPFSGVVASLVLHDLALLHKAGVDRDSAMALLTEDGATDAED